MAKELSGTNLIGGTQYFRLRKAGLYYRTDTHAYEAWNAANVTAYAVAATQDGATGVWWADMPADCADGEHSYDLFLQAGGSPAAGDVMVSQGGTINWSGMAVIRGGDVNTIKTKGVTVDAGGTTFPAIVGSGTSTLTAQQVWEYATRVLTANTNLGLPASWPASWPANWSWSTHSASDVVTALGTGSTLTACVTATGFSTHSAADVAALVLVTPANKLATDSSGYVTFANSSIAVSGTVQVNATTGWGGSALPTTFAASNLPSKYSANFDWADVVNKPTIGTSTLTAQQVWEYATRTLSAFGFTVAATGDWVTDADITALVSWGDTHWATATGFALAADWTSTRAGKIDNLDATVSSRQATVANLGTLVTDWTDGGRLDLLLDAAASGGGVVNLSTETTIIGVS